MNALVTATDLVRWADRRASQGTLPALVRRLILASIDHKAIRQIDFPAQDSVNRPGVDGLLQVTERNAFVPIGQSVWEMGVSDPPRRKAEVDYGKRTGNPGQVVPNQTAFVFVTPRRWVNKQEWIDEKSKENVWAEVRVYDADDLEQWFQICPAVVVWACRTVRGLPTSGMCDLEEVWEEWQYRTTPQIVPEVLLAGRQGAMERVRTWLSGASSVLRVRADSADEAVGFLAAVIQSTEEPERSRLRSRAVVVSTPEAWRAVASQQTLVILVAISPSLGSDALAVRRGHHVFLAYGNESGGVPVDIELPPGRKEELEGALRAMGIGERRASSLASEARGRVPVLVDLLGGCTKTPHWATPGNGPTLVPFLLAGSWSQSEGDREAMRQLCRTNEHELSYRIARWRNETDPPIQLVGTTWEWVSRRRAWPHLSHFITRDDLSAFEQTVLAVLGEVDPCLDLAPDQRWMASVHNHTRRYSDSLRKGLAATLALMATNPNNIQCGVDVPAFVRGTVRKLFGNAPDPCRWYSLASVLPILAEAAPDVFLDMVERDVLRDQDVRKQLLEQEGPFGGGGKLCHLLWSLKRLAWSPTYLSRVATILAALAEDVSTSQTGNSPDRSLRNVFLPWRPCTSATVRQRLEAIDVIARHHQDIAFRLCLELMPRRPDIVMPTSRPHWRNWAEQSEMEVSQEEYWGAVGGAFDRLLRWVGRDCERWASLLDVLPELRPAQIDAFLDEFEKAVSSTWSEQQVDSLRRAIRRLLHCLQTTQRYGPAFGEEQLKKLRAAYDRLEPEDPVQRFAWLFEYDPDLLSVHGSDWRDQEEARTRQRQEAVDWLVQQGVVDQLLRFAEHVQDPWAVGYHTGQSGITDESLIDLLTRCFESEAEKRQQFCEAAVSSRFQRDGWSWVDRLFSTDEVRTWPPAWKAKFACALPFEAATWDQVKSWGEGVSAAYWSSVEARAVHNKQRDLPRALRTLLDHQRPFAALNLACLSLLPDHDQDILVPELLLDVLRKVTAVVRDKVQTAEGFRPNGSLGHKLSQLLNVLEKAGIACEQELAQIEWFWLPLLRHTERGPATIYRLLARDPGFFAMVVGFIYRPRQAEDQDESVPEPDELTAARAEEGFRLLHEWRGMPGIWDDGSLDENELRAWVDSARRILASTGHWEVGDIQIGEVLARSPVGADGHWPHEAVRQLIEDLHSERIEEGVVLGVLNRRSTTWRSLDTGGEPERELADRYGAWAEALAPSYPRTARVLRQLHGEYLREAHWHDEQRDMDEYM